MDKLFLSEKEFQKRTEAGLKWLRRSIDVTNTPGSSAFYSRVFKPFSGWELAYPETTGYIINTFWDYAERHPQLELDRYAVRASNWICGLQLDNGALPGGFVNSKVSSVFNTGQMILGLTATFERTQDSKYLNTVDRAVSWLISILELDGSWKQGAYVKGWVPTYYTRVVWAVLWANKYLKDRKTDDVMRKALAYYSKKMTKKKSIRDWAFKENQKAFTHTIAYTIRGFLESAIILDDQTLMDLSIQLVEKIMRLRELNGKMAGRYDEDWKGDYSFTCLTGNAQLSIILTKMYQQKKDIRYLNTSLKIFGDIVYKQKLIGSKNVYGALAGSSPLWGRYLIFRYPNWATKFYLDAYRLLNIEVDKIIREKTSSEN